MITKRLAHQLIYVPQDRRWVKREQEWLKLSELGEAGSRGFVYAIGGKIPSPPLNNSFAMECEKYDVATNTWVNIASLLRGAYSMNLVDVEKKFIYVFGGQYRLSQMENTSSECIQKYDIKKDAWELFEVQFFDGAKSCQCNVYPFPRINSVTNDINERCFLIFGGFI